jgi:hypothetical protein
MINRPAGRDETTFHSEDHQMKTSGHRISIAVLFSAAAALAAGTAAAEGSITDGTQYSQQSWDGSEGNSDIGNMHTFLNATNSTWTPTWSNFTPQASASSITMLGDFAYLFGNEYQIIYAVGSGNAQMQGSSAPFSYTQSADALFYIRNDQIGSPSTWTCDGGTCKAVESSISQTLFDQDYPFTIGFIPVTISVAVNANIYARADGMGWAAAFLGRQGEFLGKSSGSLTAGAAVSAHLGMAAGIGGVVDLGITTDFDLIDISVTPHANDYLVKRPHYANLQWNVGTPVNIRSMNGNLHAFVDAGFLGRSDIDIVDWSGFNWSSNLWSDVNQVIYQ